MKASLCTRIAAQRVGLRVGLADYKLRDVSVVRGLWFVAGHRWQVSSSKLQFAVCSLLPTAYCLLLAACHHIAKSSCHHLMLPAR
jgi:hypothetical protein